MTFFGRKRDWLMWVLLVLSVILCIRLSWHFVFRLHILSFRLHTNFFMQHVWNIIFDVRCYIYWVSPFARATNRYKLKEGRGRRSRRFLKCKFAKFKTSDCAI